MKDSIKLHPKYGLNPTIPTCYFCGKDKEEVVLLGNAYKKKAHMKMTINKEPCTKCYNQMQEGITILEVKDGESGDNPYRTGKMFMFTQESCERMFTDFDFNKTKVVFIEQNTLKQILREKYDTII